MEIYYMKNLIICGSNFATGLVFGEKQNKKHSLKHFACFISSKHQIIVVEVVSL